MAVDLDAEVKRRKIADALTNGGDDSDSSEETDATDSTEETQAPEEPAAEPAAQASRREAGFLSFSDYSGTPAASPTPVPARVTYPPIAEDQAVPDYVPSPAAVGSVQPETVAAQPESVPAGHIDLGPPGRNIYTDPDTGGRYVIDQSTGRMVPHAELATAADRAAQPPGSVILPRQEVTGVDYSPEEGLPIPPEVRRAQLVKLPPSPPSPEEGLPVPLDQVRRGQLVSVPPGTAPQALPVAAPVSVSEEGSPVFPTPPKVQPAQPVTGPTLAQTRLPDTSQEPVKRAPLPDTAQGPVKQVPVTGELAQGPPGTQPAGTRDEPYWPKTAEQIGQLPAGSVYVDPRDGSLKTTPGEKAAAQPAPVTTVQPAQGASARQAAGFLSFDDYAHPKPAAAQQPTAAQPVTTTMPNGADFPQRVQAVGNNDPAAFIVHHTSGRGTVEGVVSTLNERGLGVEYVMDRAGNIFQTGGPGAQNILKGWGKGEGLSNQNVVGMEIIAKDDKDVTPQQAQSFARFIAARYPDTPLYGHGEVNPGHKEADEGQTAKAAALAYRSSGQVAETPGVPSAQPVTKLKNGFYQGEDQNSFLTGRLTTFATEDDIASGQDNGVGSKHLGGLDTTQVAGVAIPQWVLQQYFGHSTAAMRQARVDVVDPATGKRLRVPIVDIGPGPGPENAGVIADMTPALANYFGGDKNLAIKIVPKAGPDVMKNPQLFYDEQAAIQNGFDSSSVDAKRQVIGPQFAMRAQTVEEAAQAQKTVQAAVQKQQDTLTALQSKSVNMPDWFHTLEQPIPGVTDTVRNAVREEYKKQITAYAQDYYKEPDPGKAFDRIMSAPNILTSAGEIWTKAGANFQHAWLSIAQQADSPTQTKLIEFINAVHPEANPEARTQFINEVMSKTGRARVDFVNHLYNQAQAHDPDSVKNINMYSLLDSIDVSAQPGMQAREAENHARVAAAVAKNRKDLREDPTMENTYGGVISNAVAQMPKNVLEAVTPVIGQSAMFSEIYTDTLDGLRKDHPNWSEDELKAKAGSASLPQDVLQELVNLATVGMGAGLTKGITNPLTQIAVNSILHGTIASGAGMTQQALANVQTGRPVGAGVPQAGLAAGIQGLLGGAIAGRHPAEAVPRPGEREAVVQPPQVAAEPPPRPVTPAEILGPETPETTPWYKPGPIVTRAGEPEAFTPSQLAEGVAGMRASGTPEEMRQAAENLQPTADFRNRGVFLGDVGQVEFDQAMAAQARENLYPIDRQGQPKISESEPFVSQMANRFTAERMATGELGAVEPGVGVTKEEMLARGLQMPPETIAQHVSNVMNDVGGNPRDQAAAIRTEEARLSQRSRQASLASEAAPQNAQLRLDADNAFKDLTDFHNGPVAKLKNNWHAQGMTLQGEIPVDLSSYNGLRDAYLRDVGKAPPPEMEPALRATAKRVRDAADAESAAMRNLGAEIERQSARRRLPTDEEVRQRIIERMKVEPCPT